jgi:DNA-directed RNA polymerase subunit F
MPYVPKTGEETFNSDWQKAASWAQSQGIGMNSIQPVYQLDLARNQSGEYPMGAAERNLAILAAHNPNQVVSAPSDQPASPFTPSGMWHNAVSDAGKIATGLIGIFTGSFEKQIYHSAKATYEGVVDPASLNGGSFGGTLSNWLDNTLLSFVPGATDIGTLVKHGPEALLEHPVVSLLDLAGAYEGIGGILGKVGGEEGAAVAAKMATASGGYGLPGVAGKAIGGMKFGEGGVTLGGKTVDQFSVGDRIANMMAKVPGGIGPAFSRLNEAYSTAQMMGVDKWTWLLDGPIQEYKSLSPEDKTLVQQILATNRTSGGDSFRQAMEDPNVVPGVKAVIKGWINGPGRFAQQAGIMDGSIKVTYSENGDRGMWAAASDKAKFVLGAAAGRKRAQVNALKHLDALQPHVDRMQQLDEVRTTLAEEFDNSVTTARREVFNDPRLEAPITRELPKKIFGRRRGSLDRKEQLHTVIDEGGLTDSLKKAVREGNPDQIQATAEVIIERTRYWGADAVNARELGVTHPEMLKLHRTAVALKRWAQLYRREQKKIDEAIYGEEKRQKYHFDEQVAYRRQGLAGIKERHKIERENMDEGYRSIKARNLDVLARTVTKARADQVKFEEGERELAEIQKERATRAGKAQITRDMNNRIRQSNESTAATIKAARKEYLAENQKAWQKKLLDSSRMVRRHYSEFEKAKKDVAKELEGMGDTLASVVRLGDAVRAYHDALADVAPDQYKDVLKALYHKRILEHESTSALVMVADKYLRAIPKMTAKRMAEIRSNPQVIAELIDTDFNEMMLQPDLDPELAEMAKQENELYKNEAHEEFKLLYNTRHANPADNFRIQYIPTADTFDASLGRSSLRPLIGRGIPKPDLARAKVTDLTPNIHDFAVGINKAVLQALHRDTTIHLSEHYLRPMALTRRQVWEHMMVARRPEEQVAFENLTARQADIAANELGLRAFDPNALFGITLPRWSKAQTLYLPSAIVDSLERIQKDHERFILAKTNKLFRYSILGLSPRYTAHIVFGGAMMLALRSTPYMPLMIPAAMRALRDGVVPREVLRGRETELGFEGPEQMVIREFHEQGGRDMINGLAVPEHIETKQKVKMAAAQPVHKLKALAEINFNFTNYVRELYSSIAYLDGVAKVDRRVGKVKVEDPETGRIIEVSSERAVKEGIHHVQQVYGSLLRMSPIEKAIAQSVMPFYGWQKHILGYVMTFPFDHPYRAMVLSQLAYNSSNDVPLSWPIRLQFLFHLGVPDAQGNVNTIDLRTLDPFRDVANYGTLTGIFEALNPAITALPSVVNPQFSYGSTQLYPGLTYNAFYGIDTSTSGGSWINALAQFVPQVGAVQSAAQAAGGYRSEWQTNKSAAIKSLLSSLNVPFINPPINLKQISARASNARFEEAKAASTQAFQSGDFSGLAGYKTVPNPLNDAYEITPAQLEALYHQAQQQYPGVAPIEALLPPPTPYGW